MVCGTPTIARFRQACFSLRTLNTWPVCSNLIKENDILFYLHFVLFSLDINSFIMPEQEKLIFDRSLVFCGDGGTCQVKFRNPHRTQ